MTWPSLPRVVELEEGSTEVGGAHSEYTVESPTGSPVHDCVVPEPFVPAACNQYRNLARVEELAVGWSKKRNLEGITTPTSHNQFSVLSNTAIMLRASLMGVKIPDDNFAMVDILRELEVSRNLLHDKNSEKPPQVSLLMTI